MKARATSIRRCCRSSPTPSRPPRGQALVMALFLLLFLLPFCVTLYRYAAQTVRSVTRARQQKTAAQLAVDVVTDYMRQFSQDAYKGHYDAASLSRPTQSYGGGYSTVAFDADPLDHNVFLTVTAGYGRPDNPTTVKTVEALIHFQSPLTRFGTMFDAPSTISASNVTYDGGFWVNGSLSVTGAHVTFDGGPVLVQGNVSGASTDKIDGDLYYSGTSVAGVTVTGKTVNYVPPTQWPTLDFTYYSAYSTLVTTSSLTIVFNSTQTFSVVNGQTYPIPASGAIIYAGDANLTVKGVISGPVTVVAGSSTNGNCATASGKITVDGDLYYAGASSVTASAGAAFAALATNCIVFKQSHADELAAGVYFVQNGTNNMQASCTGSCSGKSFQLYGARTQLISLSGFTKSALVYDPLLRSYQPPGLPEQASLVSFRLR